MEATWMAVLQVEKGNTYGDLEVTGFVTERTATEVGAVLASALAQHVSGEGSVGVTVRQGADT